MAHAGPRNCNIIPLRRCFVRKFSLCAVLAAIALCGTFSPAQAQILRWRARSSDYPVYTFSAPAYTYPTPTYTYPSAQQSYYSTPTYSSGYSSNYYSPGESPSYRTGSSPSPTYGSYYYDPTPR